MLPLSFLDGLLNLHLRIGVLIDLGVEQRHQVFPRLDERIGHRLPAFVFQCRNYGPVVVELLVELNLSVHAAKPGEAAQATAMVTG